MGKIFKTTHMDGHNRQVDIIEQLIVILHRHAGGEEHHELLLAVLLQECKKQQEALLWWAYHIALRQNTKDAMQIKNTINSRVETQKREHSKKHSKKLHVNRRMIKHCISWYHSDRNTECRSNFIQLHINTAALLSFNDTEVPTCIELCNSALVYTGKKVRSQ